MKRKREVQEAVALQGLKKEDELHVIPNSSAQVLAALTRHSVQMCVEAASYSETRQCIESVTDYLLHHVVLEVNNGTAFYLLREVEMYLYRSATLPTAEGTAIHADHFTHQDEQQCIPGTWYFHKKGGTYKGGNYKGMDLTCGTAGVPCGILVRSLQKLLPVSTNENSTPKDVGKEDPLLSFFPTVEFVEGPCLVVECLLAECQAASISALVGNGGYQAISEVPSSDHVNPKGDQLINTKSALLRLLSTQGRMQFYAGIGPRVGLVPRSLLDLQWAGRFYRFFTYSNKQDGEHRLAKQRGGIVAAHYVCWQQEGPLGEVRWKPPTLNMSPVGLLRIITNATVKNVQAVMNIVDEVMQTKALPEGILGADVTKTEVISVIVAYCAAHDLV